MSRILVLDDDVSILKLISKILSSEGCEVFACRELEATWGILSRHSFNVVITDLQVSKLGGFDGIRLIRHVGTNFPKTTLIAISGSITKEVQHLVGGLNCRFFQKPLDMKQFIAYVKSVCVQGFPGGHLKGPGVVKEVELLEDILTSKELRSALQPIVVLGEEGPSFTVWGLESLVRVGKQSVFQNPEILFEYASNKEKLFETDCVCIKAALKEQKALNASKKLFINVHPRSLTDPRFMEKICLLIKEQGFQYNEIVLELTEQQSILNPPAFASAIQGLRGKGFGISLDDYGVGFSNLQLVQELKPDYLKISGFFCKGLDQDNFKQVILRSTAAMANQLRIPTVIEGVETEQEYKLVKNLGLTYGQGYYFARPAFADELIKSPSLKIK